jgi:hypothetical protein
MNFTPIQVGFFKGLNPKSMILTKFDQSMAGRDARK